MLTAYLTVENAAARCGVDAKTVESWVERGSLPALYLPTRGRGPLIRISPGALAAFLVSEREQLRYEEYMASAAWRALRAAAIERDDGRCRLCDSPDDLEVHHRRYPDTWPDDRLANLTTLCCGCHEIATSTIRARRYAARTIETIDVARVSAAPREGVANVPIAEPDDHRRVPDAASQRRARRPAEPLLPRDIEDRRQARQDRS